jgi:hypothetical protein
VHPPVSRVAALLHGLYYAVGGAWPLVHIESFEKVTGGKWDDWLVRTVGWLMVALAGGFLRASRRGVTRELKVVGLVSSASVGGIATYYAVRGRISKLYLLDAALQFSLTALWVRALAEPEELEPRAETGTERGKVAAVESIV